MVSNERFYICAITQPNQNKSMRKIGDKDKAPSEARKLAAKNRTWKAGRKQKAPERQLQQVAPFVNRQWVDGCASIQEAKAILQNVLDEFIAAGNPLNPDQNYQPQSGKKSIRLSISIENRYFEQFFSSDRDLLRKWLIDIVERIFKP